MTTMQVPVSPLSHDVAKEAERPSASHVERKNYAIPRELRDFTKKFSAVRRKDLGFSLKFQDIRKNPEAREIPSKNTFYQRQNQIREEWLRTKSERDVTMLSKKHAVVFLHGMAAFFEDRMTAGHYHAQDYLSQLSKVSFVSVLKPAISTSTKHIGQNVTSTENLTYPIGLVIGGGLVLNCDRGDAGTYTSGFDARYSKWQRDSPYSRAESCIQTNISPVLDEAIARPNGNIDSRGWNEISIFRPEVACVYAAVEHLAGISTEEQVFVHQICKLFALDLVLLDPDGSMINPHNGETHSLDEILSKRSGITTAKGIDILAENCELNPQIRARIAELYG